MTKTPVKILSWNVEGLISTPELNGSNYLNDYDILLLYETLMIEKPVLQNFLAFDVPAVKQQHGRPLRGVEICIKTHICSKFITRHSSTELLVISLHDILISLCCKYSPPNNNLGDDQYNISNCLVNIPRNDTIIMSGDFNCRIDSEHKQGSELIELCEGFNLTCLNESHIYTYFAPNGHSTIDLLLSNKPRLLGELLIERNDFTKHAMLLFEFTSPTNKLLLTAKNTH